MRKITNEQKEAILEKLFNRGHKTIQDISIEVNIPVSTLYTWKIKSVKMAGMNNFKSFKKASSIEKKIKILIAYYSTPDPEKGSFLRTQGILFSQIESWSKKPTDMFIGDITPYGEHLDLKNKYKQALKDLAYAEKELKNKDKIIAEGAALLMLKKKAQNHLDWKEN